MRCCGGAKTANVNTIRGEAAVVRREEPEDEALSIK